MLFSAAPIPCGILLIISTGNSLVQQAMSRNATFSWKFVSFFTSRAVSSVSCRHRPPRKWDSANRRVISRCLPACMCIIKKICFVQGKPALIFISQALLPQLVWFVIATNGFFLMFLSFFASPDSLQITELKPATTYVFIVRAENSYGLSVPSPVSSAIKTLDTDRSAMPPNELVAARAFLSGKVSYSSFSALSRINNRTLGSGSRDHNFSVYFTFVRRAFRRCFISHFRCASFHRRRCWRTSASKVLLLKAINKFPLAPPLKNPSSLLRIWRGLYVMKGQDAISYKLLLNLSDERPTGHLILPKTWHNL